MSKSHDVIATDEGCPGCGAMFGRKDDPTRHGTLPEMIGGDARVFRTSEGKVCFEVTFECPECGQDFLAEDLTDAQLIAEYDG